MNHSVYSGNDSSSSSQVILNINCVVYELCCMNYVLSTLVSQRPVLADSTNIILADVGQVLKSKIKLCVGRSNCSKSQQWCLVFHCINSFMCACASWWLRWWQGSERESIKLVSIRPSKIKQLTSWNVYPYESQQFEPFKYIGRCGHTHHEQKESAFITKWTRDVFVDYRPLYWWTTWRLHKNLKKLRETLRQITQKRCTAQTWEWEKCLKDLLATTFQVLALFQWTISNSFFVAWQWNYLHLKWKTEQALMIIRPTAHSRITTIPCAFGHNPLRFEEKCVLLPIRQLPRSFTPGLLTAAAIRNLNNRILSYLLCRSSPFSSLLGTYIQVDHFSYNKCEKSEKL